MVPPLVLVKTADDAKRLEIVEDIDHMIEHNNRHGDPSEIIKVMLSHSNPTFAMLFNNYSIHQETSQASMGDISAIKC